MVLVKKRFIIIIIIIIIILPFLAPPTDDGAHRTAYAQGRLCKKTYVFQWCTCRVVKKDLRWELVNMCELTGLKLPTCDWITQDNSFILDILV